MVHRSIFDQVVDGLSTFAGFLKVGDPTQADTVVGPLISGAQRQRVLDHIETGRKQGEVVVGGGRPEHLDTGYYVEPTLVAGTNDITVAREEIFGPVVVAIPFDDEEEGIAIANDSEFGLYDYVFSGDTPRAFRVAKLLRAGHVGHQHRPAQHGRALRRLQDERHRPRRRRHRAGGLLGDAVDHLVRAEAPAELRISDRAEVAR